MELFWFTPAANLAQEVATAGIIPAPAGLPRLKAGSKCQFNIYCQWPLLYPTVLGSVLEILHLTCTGFNSNIFAFCGDPLG